MATRVPQKGHEGFQKNTHEGATFRPKDILKNTPEVEKTQKGPLKFSMQQQKNRNNPSPKRSRPNIRMQILDFAGCAL